MVPQDVYTVCVPFSQDLSTESVEPEVVIRYRAPRNHYGNVPKTTNYRIPGLGSILLLHVGMMPLSGVLCSSSGATEM